MFAFILFAAISFGAAFYAADTLHDSKLETLFAVLFMFSLGVVGLIVTLRLSVGICPGCRSWIHRLRPVDADTETVKLYCKTCSTLWDTGINVES